MWALIYENKTSNEVVLEYWFDRKFHERRKFLNEQEDMQILWYSNKPRPGWGGKVRAFWRCLIGYRCSQKVNE